MTYRAGIIGCGSIAAAHARGYRGAAGVELVAACDPREVPRRELQERFEIPHGYSTAEEMLSRERLDLVSICLWHPLHAEFTALAAGFRPRAILCEKPMATNLEEADAMIAACSDQGVRLVIGHQRRFYPSWTHARELIAGGRIGTPLMVTVETGDGLLNCGTHVVDAVRYLLGDPECDWVMGAVERTTDRWERGIRIEDCGMGLARFRTGAQALIQSDLTGTNQVDGYAVRGTSGLLEVDAKQVRVCGFGGADETIDCGTCEPWVEQVRETIAWIEDAELQHRGAGRHGRSALELLMALYQSARERAVVRLPLVERSNPLDRMVEEGSLPVREPGRYDIRAFLTFGSEDQQRYRELVRSGMHPRVALATMDRSMQ